MVLERVHQIEMNCSCGCSTLEISQWYDDDKPQEIFISHKLKSFDAYYYPGWNRFKEKAKLIWAIIRGKEYYFYELDLMKKEEIKAFKDAVALLNENVDYSN